MSSESKPEKTVFWQKLTLRHLTEMRALKLAGLLDNYPDHVKLQRGWRNISEHSIIQAAAHEIVGKLDGSGIEQINEQVTTALVSDTDKRMNNGDLSPEQIEKFNELKNRINPNQDYIRAQSGLQNHVDILIEGRILSYQAIKSWYIDNITGVRLNPTTNQEEADIVSINERIDDLIRRKGAYGSDIPQNYKEFMETTLAEEFGWTGKYDYWEVERFLTKLAETEIFKRLKSKGIDIKSPEDIPTFIKNKIEEQYAV